VNTSATESVLAERAQMRARIDAANEAILTLRTLIANQRKRISTNTVDEESALFTDGRPGERCLREGATVIGGNGRGPHPNCGKRKP
jgi:hypothetical protein